MEYIKKLGISFLFLFSSFIILTMIMTIFSYFNILGDKTTNIFKIIIPIISLFIGGFYIGKKSIKKGWLEGLKLSIICSIIIVIINYLVYSSPFESKNILYYIILIASSVLGSMIGINFKQKNNDL